MPLASPPVPYQMVPVSQITPPNRVQKESSTPKTWSATPPVQNKYTPKTKTKTKNKTPSNDIRERPFCERILQYISHQYGKNFISREADHIVRRDQLWTSVSGPLSGWE